MDFVLFMNIFSFLKIKIYFIFYWLIGGYYCCIGNILLVSIGVLSGEVKIIDFGFSKVMDSSDDSMDFIL